MDQPAQKGAGGDDNSPGGELAAVTQPNAGDAAVRNHQIVRLAFDNAEIGGLHDRGLHRRRIKFAIGLGARPANGGTLAAVQHPKLDPASVGDPAHQTVQGIHFADQMALAETANGGIAGHGANGRETVGDQRGLRTHPGGRTRGFAAGMAAANDDDVK